MIEEFNCKMCDFIEEYPNENSPTKCPKCDSAWYILSFLEKSRVPVEFVSIGYKDTPRYSASLGVSETQIEAAKKLHPQAEWKKFGHSYRPLIKNWGDKKKLMEQANFCEYDPKAFKGREN